MASGFGDLTIDVETRGETCCIRVQGSICDEGTIQTRETLLKALEAGTPRLLLDCSGVTYISSSGIGTLVSILKKSHEAEIAFGLHGLNPAIRELFELTRLDNVFTIVSDLETWEATTSS